MSKQQQSSATDAHLEKKYSVIEKILKEDGAQDIKKINLKNHSALFDVMYVSSGLSERHISSIAEKIAQALKDIDSTYVPREGEGTGWNVVDGGDMVVHVLTPQARERYRLEDIWSSDFDNREENPVITL